MRILIVGDPKWYAPEVAEQVVARLIVRHGPSLTIVHGAGPGVDRAFAEACADHDVEQEPHPPRWREVRRPASVLRLDRRKVAYDANAPAIRNAEMITAGAEMCLAFHRDLRLAKDPRDFALLAIEAGIPTYLIADESATPRRIRIKDLL